MSVKNKPAIEAYIGASGSGKGVSIDRRLHDLKPARLLIWDPRDEYKDWAVKVTSMSALVSGFQKAGRGAVRARFVPGGAMKLEQAFALCCELAFEVGNLVFVAEELSDVTSASRAPAAWRRLTTQGRHQGLHLIGAAQRPALIDKTFLGNATFIRCFTLRYRSDRIAMAQALDTTEPDIAALQTTDVGGKRTVINWMERDFRGGKLTKGTTSLSR